MLFLWGVIKGCLICLFQAQLRHFVKNDEVELDFDEVKGYTIDKQKFVDKEIKMRKFAYTEKWKELLNPEIVGYLTIIHEYKGRQQLIAERHADVLDDLMEVAKIQSTESSNNIEGIYTTDNRLKKIVLDKTTPKTRDEREIAGYRDVLNTIHENYEHIPIRDTFILQLHRDLYKFENASNGGQFKTADNVIEEEDSAGNKFVRFRPMPAWETPDAIINLCHAYQEALDKSEADALLIIPMFVLDFLSIHPFNDGNGRLSRLLTLLLLYQNDYIVGRYISLEKLIEQTKERYYDALWESSRGWMDNENDYEPFVKYLLGIVTAAYRDFFDRAQIVEEKKVPKPDRIEELIKEHLGTITKAEIVRKAPGISLTTVQRTLTELVKEEKIIKIGGGRYTKYKWNWNKEK